MSKQIKIGDECYRNIKELSLVHKVTIHDLATAILKSYFESPEKPEITVNYRGTTIKI